MRSIKKKNYHVFFKVDVLVSIRGTLHCVWWANMRSHIAIPFNQNQNLCVVGLT
jgi:hypothetical protein